MKRLLPIAFAALAALSAAACAGPMTYGSAESPKSIGAPNMVDR